MDPTSETSKVPCTKIFITMFIWKENWKQIIGNNSATRQAELVCDAANTPGMVYSLVILGGLFHALLASFYPKCSV